MAASAPRCQNLSGTVLRGPRQAPPVEEGVPGHGTLVGDVAISQELECFVEV